jgi:hypothetical protein
MKQLSCFKWHSSVGTVHYVKWSEEPLVMW